LPQSPEKSLDVGHLATGLSDLLVAGIVFENWPIGFPEVAKASALPVALRNPVPEPGTSFGRTVPYHECYDLTCPTAESDPQPPFVRPFSDICPALIEFKDIVLLGRLEPISY
jgi:hypothetical protein